MVNLRNFDLNLLVIFRAIINRGLVAGAAEDIGLSPSAVSHALGRLRIMLNDELFFRTTDGALH
jgi:DNA-binding transcriptional LysR family regulator